MVRIGTRSSQLAQFQANQVKHCLANFGIDSDLVFIESAGDLNLIQPMYTMGIEGIFTKELDIALLNNQIDIAVHSLKDVPATLAAGIKLGAFLPRASTQDILVTKKPISNSALTNSKHIIATGSIRRKAQWLAKYPNHNIVNLRGNVNTRLDKLRDSEWTGAIFAKAGLERIDLLPENYTDLLWMTPPAGQGVISIAQRTEDELLFEYLQKINDSETALCTSFERSFLRGIGGGCSQPIGAYAFIVNRKFKFKCNYTIENGCKEWSRNYEVDIENYDITEAVDLGIKMRLEIEKNISKS